MPEGYFVYMIPDKAGVIRYIGAGSGKRASLRSPRSHKVEAWIASGEALSPVKLRTGLTRGKSYEIEKLYIATYGRQCDGGTLLNASTGGQYSSAGIERTPEHRAAIAASQPKSLATRAANRLKRKAISAGLLA
jgi:hypothetical protein